jgi:hypothetical protein
MPVKYFDWDDAKNAKLRTERGIGFEDVGFQTLLACDTSTGAAQGKGWVTSLDRSVAAERARSSPTFGLRTKSLGLCPVVAAGAFTE